MNGPNMPSSLECNGNAEEEYLQKEKIIKERSGGYNEWIKKVLNDCFEESEECNNNLVNSDTANNNNRPKGHKVHTLVKKNDVRTNRKALRTEKGKACLEKDRWTHDLYKEDEQRTVTAEELIGRYGYNIRAGNAPPPLRNTPAARRAQKRKRESDWLKNRHREQDQQFDDLPTKSVERQKKRHREQDQHFDDMATKSVERQKNRDRKQKLHYDDLATKSLLYKTDGEDHLMRPFASKWQRLDLGNSGWQVKSEECFHRVVNSIVENASKRMADAIQVVETHISEVRNRAEQSLEDLKQDAIRQVKTALEAAERGNRTAEGGAGNSVLH